MDLIQRTIDLANANVERGGRPFACIVAKGGEIIAEAVNLVAQTHDPTAHAEICAIREASAKLGTEHFIGCEFSILAHPCPMATSVGQGSRRSVSTLIVEPPAVGASVARGGARIALRIFTSGLSAIHAGNLIRCNPLNHRMFIRLAPLAFARTGSASHFSAMIGIP